jgi:hypothetical protein
MRALRSSASILPQKNSRRMSERPAAQAERMAMLTWSSPKM